MLYILFSSFLGFVIGLFQARNNFKYPFYKEIFFQIVRLILVPLAVIYFISKSQDFIVASVIVALSLCFLLSIYFLYPNIVRMRKD